MNWVMLAGSFAGVLLLTGIAWALGLGRIRPLTPAEARDMAELRLTAFHASDTWVSEDGAGALVLGDGEAALIKRHGADYALRRLNLPLQVTQDVHGLLVETGEKLYGSVHLTLSQQNRDKLLTLV